ncbi:hypothetical protein H7H52_00460, partial [Mycolicibacter hiberniae]|uniref:amidase family protein n=1 Tax=Mycolicibacter hiberniae TaxID=29314 RepID=UPI0021F313D9
LHTFGHDEFCPPALANEPLLELHTFGHDEFCPPALANEPLLERLMGWVLTYPFNMTTNPAISIPAGFTSDGMPVGLQIVGRLRADADVLCAAAAFETMRPWAQNRPRNSPTVVEKS